MHYVFDTEFGLRLAYAGELPVLIEPELAVRLVHEEAKSWTPERFREEERRFIELYAPRLTRGERLKLALARIAMRLGVFRLTGAASRLWRRLGGRPRRTP
jgi:hypothetical protein